MWFHGPFCASSEPRRGGRVLAAAALCSLLRELTLQAVALPDRSSGLGDGALCFQGAFAGELAGLIQCTEQPRRGGIRPTREIGPFCVKATRKLGALGLELPLQVTDLSVARAAVLLQGRNFSGAAHFRGLERLGALVRRGELLAGEGEGRLESAGPAGESLLARGELPGLFLERSGTLEEGPFTVGELIAPFLPCSPERLVPERLEGS